MVAALGGPRDVFADARLAVAPVYVPVPALRAGHVTDIDVRGLGWAVVVLGGGRVRPGDLVDPRVGLAGIVGRGVALRAGEPLAWVHAADAAAAAAAVAAVQQAMRLDDEPPVALPLVTHIVSGTE